MTHARSRSPRVGAIRGSRSSLTLAVAPSPSALPAVREQVRVFLNGLAAPDNSIDDVILCLHEACKNAIRFSGSDRAIDVAVSVRRGEIRLVVRDHGVGFKQRVADAIRLPDPLEPQGRGLFLIAALMDHVTVVNDHGTIVKMTRRLAP
jgi:anti-sigma regulatory factor (Ser/Thr protein kinase)